MDYYDTLHQLASIWLEQQDLSGKSSADISDMYFIALREIHQVYNEKYAPKKTASVIAFMRPSQRLLRIKAFVDRLAGNLAKYE